MPLGDPDKPGPKPTDLQWLDGRVRIMCPEAEIQVFAEGALAKGHVVVRITHDGSYKDLTAPLGMVANRDFERLLSHWRDEQHEKPWAVAPKKLYQPGVIRRVAPPLRKGQTVH